MTDVVVVTITSITALIVTLVPAYWLHKREVNKYKNEINQYKVRGNILDKVLEFSLLNVIKDAVNSIFERTSADRFLVIIAINGKVEFKTVSVVFERHKDETKNQATIKYKHLEVDSHYVQLLKSVERDGSVLITVPEMENSLLKRIYEIEGVFASEIKFITRKHIDNHNDCLVYVSIATHEPMLFTDLERTIFHTDISSIIKPTILKMIN